MSSVFNKPQTIDKDIPFGITFCSNHAYRILRASNKNGGGSVLSQTEIDEVILGRILGRTVDELKSLIPQGKLKYSLESVDKTMPISFRRDEKRIRDFLAEHGPSAALAIGIINTIIGMQDMAVKDCYFYLDLKSKLPAESFSDFVRIVTEFEKEMK